MKTALVSLSFDDGLRVQLDYAVPELERRGIRGTFFLCGKHVTRDFDGWREVARRGHEIGSHTMHHLKATTQTPGDFLRDALDSQRVLSGAFDAPVISLAYPYAISNSAVQKLAASVYEQARGGHGSPGELVMRKPGNMYDTPSFNTSPASMDHIPALLSKAIWRRGWLTLMLHGVGPDNTQFDNVPTADFCALLDRLAHLQARGLIRVLPYGDAARELRGFHAG